LRKTPLASKKFENILTCTSDKIVRRIRTLVVAIAAVGSLELRYV
jgi:hypothetical protein